MAANVELPSGRWEVQRRPILEPASPASQCLIVFQKPDRPRSRMHADCPAAPIDLDRLGQEQFRMLARDVYDRWEELDGVVWVFRASKPMPNELFGVPRAFELPRRAVTFEAAGDARARGWAFLPEGRYLGHATDGELAGVIRTGTRQG